MENRAYEIFSSVDRDVRIKVISGHFVTKHSHINNCIDMTQIKSQAISAKAAAKLLAARFSSTPVDTIVTLDRMKMVGAFMAEELSQSGINQRQDIAVITPEINEDKMLLRDNFLPYVKGRHVLLLTASATTGISVVSVVEGVRYYGGTPVGAAAVFGDEFECDVPVFHLFGVNDIEGYASFTSQDCPLCKRGVKVDALINSYGYSKIL